MTRRNKPGWRVLRWLVGAIYLFILGPIAITASVSFNAANRSAFPPQGFSVHWWGQALSHRWLDPLLLSLQVGVSAALLSTALGLPLAFALTRYRFRGRPAIEALALSPLALPSLVTGIGILQTMQVVGLRSALGFGSLLVGHVVICVPFCVRTIAVSLHTMPNRVEDAAAGLGAPPAAVFLLVTLPLIKSGVFAGMVFAFVQSFTDYSIALFLSRAGTRPVNMAIMSALEFGFEPTLAAVAVITMLIPLALIFAVERLFRIGDFLYGGRARA